MPRPFHPLHAVLLAGTVPLFLGVLLTDIAYVSTYEVQWKNFASWLIVGGLVFSGFALLLAVVELARTELHRPRIALYSLLLLAVFVLGLINAFVHAGDAWESVPTGPVLSGIVAVLSIVATGLRFHASQLYATHPRQAA